MCVVNLVYPADPVCQAVLLSATGSYVTVLITATRITCSALADTHSFSPNFPRSVTISSSPCFLSLKSQLFPSRSIKRSLKYFVSFCLFPSSVATSFLYALFICVTLAASQNPQPVSASPSFSLFHCPLYQSSSIVSALSI